MVCPWSASYNECNSDQDVGICRPILIGSLKLRSGTLTRSQVRFPSSRQWPPCHSTGILRDHSSARGSAQFGSGRNAFTGPSFFNSDISLFKNFAITERFGAQFRFEAFNVFNHVNLNNPNNCIDCSGSGLITSLAPNAQMRQLNFGMKVTF